MNVVREKEKKIHVVGLNTTMLADVGPAIDWMATLFAQPQDVEKFIKEHQLPLISLVKDLQSAIQNLAFGKNELLDQFIKKYDVQLLAKADVSLANTPLVFFDNLPDRESPELINKPCSVALGKIARIGVEKQIEIHAFGVTTLVYNSERMLLPGKHFNESDYQIGYPYPQNSIMFCRLPVKGCKK